MQIPVWGFRFPEAWNNRFHSNFRNKAFTQVLQMHTLCWKKAHCCCSWVFEEHSRLTTQTQAQVCGGTPVSPHILCRDHLFLSQRQGFLISMATRKLNSFSLHICKRTHTQTQWITHTSLRGGNTACFLKQEAAVFRSSPKGCCTFDSVIPPAIL